MKAPVESSVEQRVTTALTTHLDGVNGVKLWSEIQDGGEFLLLGVDTLNETGQQSDLRDFLKVAAAHLENAIPPREGDYRWMVVIRVRGTVVDSVMGGWSGRSTV